MAKEETGYKRYAIVFDLETGGFTPGEDAVVEIGAVAVSLDTLKIDSENRFHSLIKPYENPEGKKMNISQQALNVNKLTMDTIMEEGNSLKDVCDAFISWLADYKVNARIGLPILAGHNIRGFDIPHLFNMFECNGSDKKLKKAVCSEVFDTLTLGRMMFSKSAAGGDHKLGTICTALGIPHSMAHSAMQDAMANAKMFVSIVQRMRGVGLAEAGEERVRFRDEFVF